MSYTVKIFWEKGLSEAFVDNKYSRAHRWFFDGGVELPASSSPHVVPLPMSVEAAVDPEEAFVAALSSCHLLWFLSLAAAKKYIVESYEDNAEGILAKDAKGKLAMTEVTLKPLVKFGGDNIPSPTQVDELHHQAHEKCFIANSVKTKINVVPAYTEREIREMRDLAIRLENRPGALAEMGEALGGAGVSVEGGGAFVVDGTGIAHFLFEDATAARQALEAKGIEVLEDREVLIQRLKQDVPGQLGKISRLMAEAGVNIEIIYSDHQNQLILVVDDLEKGRTVSKAWTTGTAK